LPQEREIMTEQYVMPFVQECAAAFKNMGGIELSAGRPYVTERGGISQGDISSVIELSGGVTGAVAISLNQDAAIKLADTVTGLPHTGLDDETAEVISELVNVFAGQAKKHFEKITELLLSLPTELRNKQMFLPGKEVGTGSGKQARYIGVPFNRGEEDFLILSITIEPVEERESNHE
jgi:chemotaxis protein CheX